MRKNATNPIKNKSKSLKIASDISYEYLKIATKREKIPKIAYKN